MIIVTPLCSLRAWVEADQCELVRLADNRKIWRNMTHMFPHPYTRSDAVQWLQSIQNMPPNTHFAIEVGGRVAGAIGAVAGQGVFSKSAEFGYWLGERYWGRGIATQAAQAYSRYIMRAMPIHRLQSYVFAWNSASMRVLVKTGFSHDATLKRSAVKDGTIVDEWVFGLTDEQLRALGDSTQLFPTESGFIWRANPTGERLPSARRHIFHHSPVQEDGQRDRQLIRL